MKRISAACVVLTMATALVSHAAEVTPEQAQRAAENWIGANPRRMGAAFLSATPANTETVSNETRVARQDWLMRKLFDAISSSSRSELAETILDEAAEYIETDLDADTISKITEYRMESEGLKIPGEVKTGDLHDEFYVDQEALQELLLTLFYDPAA